MPTSTYTIHDLTRLASQRDGLEQAKEVIEQKLAQVNDELDRVAAAVEATIPTEEEMVLVDGSMGFEDSYPGLEELEQVV